MISRDEAFAQGWRLAWRNIWLIVAVFALAFVGMSFLGYCWMLLERFMQ